jgi:hypothetical protein
MWGKHRSAKVWSDSPPSRLGVASLVSKALGWCDSLTGEEDTISSLVEEIWLPAARLLSEGLRNVLTHRHSARDVWVGLAYHGASQCMYTHI